MYINPIVRFSCSLFPCSTHHTYRSYNLSHAIRRPSIKSVAHNEPNARLIFTHASFKHVTYTRIYTVRRKTKTNLHGCDIEQYTILFVLFFKVCYRTLVFRTYKNTKTYARRGRKFSVIHTGADIIMSFSRKFTAVRGAQRMNTHAYMYTYFCARTYRS